MKRSSPSVIPRCTLLIIIFLFIINKLLIVQAAPYGPNDYTTPTSAPAPLSISTESINDSPTTDDDTTDPTTDDDTSIIILAGESPTIAIDDVATTVPNTSVTIPILANDIDNHLMIVFAIDGHFNQVCSIDEYNELKCNQLGFNTSTSYRLALGDINQDGLLDAVFANYERPNQVCLATGSDFLCRQIGEHALRSMDVALADVNGDRILDAIFANRDNRNSVCLGDGQGEFSCQQINDLPARSFGVTVDDFNQNGHLDALFATFFQYDTLCLGDGQGGFECNALSSFATSSVAVASGDLNGDHRIDAIFSTISGANQICLNEGQGVFSCTDLIHAQEPFRSNHVALADIDNDDQLDAVLAIPGEPNRICFGDGSGQFACEQVPGSFWSYSSAVGYINEDEILDIVFANDGDPNRLCLGQGQGQFVCQALNEDRLFTTDVALGFLGFDLNHLHIVTSPVHGRARIDADSNLIYTPSFGFSGRDTVSYQINGATALVSITVTPQVKYSSEPPPHRVLDLGKTLLEQPVRLTLTVQNEGNLPVVLDSATFSGEHAQTFNLVSPTLPFTVEELSADITIECYPLDTGIKTATLTLQTNDPQQPNPSYPLRCSSHLTPEAGYWSQPTVNSTVDLGKTLLNTTVTAELTIFEKGDAPLIVELIAIGGNNPENFQLLNAHWPLTIADGGFPRILTIQCMPTQLGIQTALLKLSTNDPQYPSPIYSLSCRGHNGPQAIYTSQPPVGEVLDFGKTQIPVTLSVDIIEQGNIPLEVTFSEIQGPHAEDFALINPELPITLADGDPPLSVTLQCTPSDINIRTASLVLYSNDSQQPTLTYPLTCTGHPHPQAGYASKPAVESYLNLGTSALNQAITTTLTLMEKGDRALEVNLLAIEGEHADDFELITPKSWPLRLEDQAPAQEIMIQCMPSAAGNRSATLILTSNDPLIPQPRYQLTCSGQDTQGNEAHYVSTPPPQTLLAFGETPIATPVTTTLTISNPESAPLTLELEQLSGQHADEFQILTPTLPLTLVQEQVSITLQCQPAKAGVRTATLMLKSTDPNQATATYPLRCQGQAINAVASLSPEPAPPAYQAGQLLIKLNQTEALTADIEFKALMQEFNVEHIVPLLKETQPFYLLELPVEADIPKAATTFSATLAVDYAEPNYILTPLTHDPHQQTVVPRNLEQGWALMTGDAEVVLAIVDTGIDLSHEDLKDKIISGYNFVAQDNEAQDDQGHGTLVAGLAAAMTNNHIGIAGICWSCQLMPIKVADQQGRATVARLLQGIQYAIEQGADIIHIGLGSPQYARMLHELIRAHPEVPMVAATGNQGSSAIDYPAKLPQTIAVGALDAQGQQWSDSNGGEAIDLVAPGVELVSTGLNNSYSTALSGTSLAAAQVTGALGLLVSLCPEMTAADMRTLLTETAHDLGAPGWDPDYGHGELDVEALLLAAKTNNCFAKPLPCSATPTLTSAANGQWQDPLTWTPQRQPQREDIVLIRPQHTVTAAPQVMHIQGLCHHGHLRGLPQQTLMLVTGEHGFIDNYGQISAATGDQNQHCADAGSNILLKTINGHIHNYPQALMASGAGGDNRELECSPTDGGQLALLAREVINEGELISGSGGHISTKLFTSQGGKGGDIYLKGSFKAPGQIVQAASGLIQAGMGGQGYYGGQGGEVKLKVLPQLRLQGQLFSGAGGEGVIQGRYGKMIIDPTQLTLGPSVEIIGGKIMTFCAPPCTLDLSQLQTAAIVAHADLILAAGQLDLSQSATHALSTAKQAQLFVDHIQTERPLTEMIAAKDGLSQYPAQTFADVTLIAPTQLQGVAGQSLTIPLTLINESEHSQRYQFTVTDLAGWSFEHLPSSVSVAAQGIIDETQGLYITVTLPITVDNMLTITATAEHQAELTTTVQIQVTTATVAPLISAAQDDSLTHSWLTQPIDNRLPLCPLTGYIDWLCRNEDQVMTDVVLGPHANVAGGRLAGHIDNQGLVSQVIIEAGAYFQGGKVTGYVINQGTMADFEFVGAEIYGGLLAGQVVNNSRIGATFTDVCLAAHAQLKGGYIQGKIRNQEHAQPGRLSDLVVKLGSQLSPMLEIDAQTVKLAEGIEWLAAEHDQCEQLR